MSTQTKRLLVVSSIHLTDESIGLDELQQHIDRLKQEYGEGVADRGYLYTEADTYSSSDLYLGFHRPETDEEQQARLELEAKERKKKAAARARKLAARRQSEAEDKAKRKELYEQLHKEFGEEP